MTKDELEKAEIMALIEELTVSELVLAEELRLFGEIISSAPVFTLQTSREDSKSAH